MKAGKRPTWTNLKSVFIYSDAEAGSQEKMIIFFNKDIWMVKKRQEGSVCEGLEGRFAMG